MSYNGWTNKETWLVTLWYGDYLQESLAESPYRDKYDAANYLKDIIDELTETQMQDGFIQDIFNCAWFEINWHELAEAYLFDIQAEENA